MAAVALSHRLGDAMGQHRVTLDERRVIFAAAVVADDWDALPAEVRRLVERIEARPGWLEESA